MISPGTLVRVVWPGSPFNGRRGTVAAPVTVDGLTRLGALYAVYFAPLHDTVVFRADQLKLEGSRD